MIPRAAIAEARRVLFAAALMAWTLLPIYHMVMLSVTPARDAVGTHLWPPAPTLDNYRTVFAQGHFFLHDFWQQLANSTFVALMTCGLVLAIASLASYAISRLRLAFAHYVSNAALLTYLIPAAFLAIPMYRIMHIYGLLDSRWALILAMVTFATPYAIWVLKQYSESIPIELDEAARVDGATVMQVFWHVYLPLIAPALVAIGTYALLLSWNEYLYAFLMLSTPQRVTLPVALAYFLSSDDSPWALLMATSVIYALPPTALYYAVRKHMTAGLAAGAVKA
ncbi:MAG: carbohydrate ABC transporter permease [Xanthobacteraceae bacterium]|jgi:multiple sugar transport system permease protein